VVVIFFEPGFGPGLAFGFEVSLTTFFGAFVDFEVFLLIDF
jgi:hypothetical protein